MKKIIFLCFAIFLTACLPSGVQIPQSPALRFLENKSGNIAYVGNDGNIHLTDSGATYDKQLTTDITPENREKAVYRLPAWSHDSNQLAYIRLEQTSETNINSEIFITDVEKESSIRVYESDREYPIYISWSPNNQSIGLLSSSESRQKVILKNLPADGSSLQVLDTGNPFYWSWAPDGTTLLVHKNGLKDAQQLAFLKTDSEITEYLLDETPASFQTPAWSPSGEFILISTLSKDGKKQIVLTDSTGANPKPIADVKIKTAFAWASDSEQFAYILGSRDIEIGAIGALHIADIFGREEIVIDEDVFAFFWSPDAKQLAYFIPQIFTPENADGSKGEQALYLSLNVVDTGNGETHEVAVYQPTQEFFTILQYIDQYHQSVTIWSPDSNNLVLSFMTQEGVPGIAVAPASGVTEPRFVAEGSFAVWSWE